VVSNELPALALTPPKPKKSPAVPAIRDRLDPQSARRHDEVWVEFGKHGVYVPAAKGGPGSQDVLQPGCLGIMLACAVAELKVLGVQRVQGPSILMKDRGFQEAVEWRDREPLLSAGGSGLTQKAEGQKGDPGWEAVEQHRRAPLRLSSNETRVSRGRQLQAVVGPHWEPDAPRCSECSTERRQEPRQPMAEACQLHAVVKLPMPQMMRTEPVTGPLPLATCWA